MFTVEKLEDIKDTKPHPQETPPLQTVPAHHRAAHFVSWTARMLVPGATIAGPGLGENIRLLRKSPHFRPLRIALTVWVMFMFAVGALGIYSLAKAPPSHASNDFSVKTGYYLGTGVALSITGLGFRPEAVIIKADTAAGQLVWKSTAMPSAVSAYLGVATADNTETEITLDADGFTVSAALEVNTVNVRYTYIAFAGSDCTSGGAMCIGVYTGDGAATKAITAVGFQPDLVWVKRTTAVVGNFRTSAMSTNHGAYFSATANDTTGVLFRTLDSTGFTVGLTNNTAYGLFYYVAFKNLANKAYVGTFSGNGTDDRNITGVGFTPNFVLVKQDAAIVPAFSQTYTWGDYSSVTTAAANAANHIQALQSDGFQVGNSTSVNASGVNSYYFAFGGSAAPSPSGSFFMQRGSYTGSGVARTIETSFAPDLVIIKGDTTQYAVFGTSIQNNLTQYFSTAVVGFADGITSMTGTGFTLGTHTTVNTNGTTYEWIAYGNATSPHTGNGASDFIIGAYTGTGVTGRVVNNLGVTPSMLTIGKSLATANQAIWKSSSMADNTCAYFSATVNSTDGTLCQAFVTGGFTVGSSAVTNTAAVVYVFFAFTEGSYFDVGSYAGNGVADTEITGTGFQPDFLWTKRDVATAAAAVHKSSSSTIAANGSQHFMNLSNDTNDIKTFTSNGFTLGTSNEVNTTVGTYYYAAWLRTTSSNAPTTPTNSVPASSATAVDLNATLTGSAYADSDSNAQTDAQWQVDDDSDFATPVWTRTAGTGEITTTVTSAKGTFANELSGKTALDHNSTYYWRVRYSDGVYSSWSTGTSFTTNTVATPSNSSPADQATVTSLTPTLTESAFSDAQSGHTASSSDWEISTSSGFSSTVYDSGTVVYSTTLAVPSATLADKTVYYWRVRHQDSTGQWSSYSTPTRFITAESQVTVKPLFGSTVVTQADTVKIDAQVKLANGTAINNAETTIDIYNPSGTQIVHNSAMSYVASSSGVYRYAYTIPSTNGSYLYEVTASASAIMGYGAANFEVRGATTVDLTPVTTGLDKLVGAFIVVQASVSDAGPASASFTTSLTKTTTDFYKNAVLTFTSGSLTGQSRRVSAYNGTTKTVTLSPDLSSPPANGDLFTIVAQNVYVEEQVADLQTSVASISSDVTSIKTDVASILSRLTSIDASISSLTSKVNNSVTQVYTIKPEDMFNSMSAISGDIKKIYTSLGSLSAPDSLLAVNQASLTTLKDVQNKLADLNAASSVVRRVVESNAAQPVVETYMKFNSVEIHFLVTNPLSTTQTVKFKAFLPVEAKPEHVLNADGLVVDYDPAANTYFVAGDITLTGNQTVTRKVELKDIWVFDAKELEAYKNQSQSLVKALQSTQYGAQAVLLKNDVDTNVAAVTDHQTTSYTSPQDHIVAYRDNTIKVDQVKADIEKLKDLVTQSGASGGLAGNIGNIQTFATWGIIIAILTGIGLLGLMFYTMWKHQMQVSLVALQMNKKILGDLEHNEEPTKPADPVDPADAFLRESPVTPQKPEKKGRWRRILMTLGILGVCIIIAIFVEDRFFKKQSSIEVPNMTETPVVTPTVTSTASATPAPKTLKIKPTETGTLNVRATPDAKGTIITKVQPGSTYPYDQVQNNWYHITISPQESGWVSGDYVEI